MFHRTASLVVAMAFGAVLVAGCKDDKSQDAKPAPAANPTGDSEHTNQIKLGETSVNGLKIVALQDEPVKPGGEGAFDLQITGYPQGGKPKAVRFWVGTESGDDSLKALAEE